MSGKRAKFQQLASDLGAFSSIYPSAHDPGMVQIPIANTGSLPDLTNMDFTSPIHAPLDQDQDNSSPYSSVSVTHERVKLLTKMTWLIDFQSPINTSPSTLSPTSMMPGIRNHNRFNFTPPISQSLSVRKALKVLIVATISGCGLFSLFCFCSTLLCARLYFYFARFYYFVSESFISSQ